MVERIARIKNPIPIIFLDNPILPSLGTTAPTPNAKDATHKSTNNIVAKLIEKLITLKYFKHTVIIKIAIIKADFIFILLIIISSFHKF